MTDLLPPNATALERAVDGASARFDELEAPIRDLWSPRRCPLALLPWLAWALGVETWRADWPEATKRRAVEEAIQVHREKGTVAAIRRVLDLIGAEYDYVEEPAGNPLTAKVVIYNSAAILLLDLGEVTDALDRAKRASVQLDIELQSGFMADVPVRAGFGVLQFIDFGVVEGAA